MSLCLCVSVSLDLWVSGSLCLCFYARVVVLDMLIAAVVATALVIVAVVVVDAVVVSKAAFAIVKRHWRPCIKSGKRPQGICS